MEEVKGNALTVTLNESLTQEIRRVKAVNSSFRYSEGRTISLGNYQFARITVGAKANSLDDAINFTNEALNREVSKLTGESYEFQLLPQVNEVELEYGLTLKIAKFESGRIDVSASLPVEGSVEASLKILQDALMENVKRASEKIGMLKKASEILGC